jgi:hypothetical protein
VGRRTLSLWAHLYEDTEGSSGRRSGGWKLWAAGLSVCGHTLYEDTDGSSG